MDAPNHCGNNDGDASCAEGQYCSLCHAPNDGCIDTVPEPGCRAPTPSNGTSSGSAETTASEASTGATSSGTSEVSLDSTATDTTGIPGCLSDADCNDPTAPFCDQSGACVGCDALADPNDACVELGAQTPVCARGACVSCDEGAAACGGQTPVCSPEVGCRACTEHFECPQSACHLDGDDVGACFDEAEVIAINDTTDLAGTVATIQAEDRAVLVLEPGFYPITVDIGDSAEVAILGTGMSPPILAGDGARAVEVFGDAIVYLSNVEVSNSNIANNGLECTGRSAWVDDSVLDYNQIGIATSGCSLHVRRSSVLYNTERGIECSAGSLSLRNTAVGFNGDEFTPTGGLRLISTTVDIAYSIIVANRSDVAGEASVSCAGGEQGDLRNSIIVSAFVGVVGCDGIAFANNAIDAAGLGKSNVEVGPPTANWFLGLGAGDFHLTPAGATVFADIAQWQEGDPTTDIDGDPIPTGMPSVPGYDQP